MCSKEEIISNSILNDKSFYETFHVQNMGITPYLS